MGIGGFGAIGAFLLLVAPHGVTGQVAPNAAWWLAGCWEARTAGRVTVEMWSPAAGDLMIGGSRTVAGGATVEFEHLRIHGTGSALRYVALPSRQSEAAFEGTHASDSLLVFENPEHDFPQKIAYRRVPPDSLRARVSAADSTGAESGFETAFARVPCAPGESRGERGAG